VLVCDSGDWGGVVDHRGGGHRKTPVASWRPELRVKRGTHRARRPSARARLPSATQTASIAASARELRRAIAGKPARPKHPASSLHGGRSLSFTGRAEFFWSPRWSPRDKPRLSRCFPQGPWDHKNSSATRARRRWLLPYPERRFPRWRVGRASWKVWEFPWVRDPHLEGGCNPGSSRGRSGGNERSTALDVKGLLWQFSESAGHNVQW